MDKKTRSVLLAVLITLLVASTASAWNQQPSRPAPKPATPSGPPPAWVETTAASQWLAYSGYCWKTVCADYLPPASRSDLSSIVEAKGATVRFHFAFRPSSISVTTLGPKVVTRRLVSASVVSWRPPSEGVFTLALKAPSGTAGYVGRIRFR